MDGDKFWVCQNKLKLRDKTTSAPLAHHFTQKRQALTLQSEENYLLVRSDIKGIVHLASSNGANGQPVIPHRYSGAFNRKNVLPKTSFSLNMWALYYDNVPCHSPVSVMQFFTQRQITTIEHLLCWLDLASYYFLCFQNYV